MPGEESEQRLRQLIVIKFMPILKKEHDEEKLREAYNAVKYDAFNEGLRFSNPTASFQGAFKAVFAEMGKKLGLDLSFETNFIVDEIPYDMELPSFKAEEPVVYAPMAEKPLGGELDAIIHKLAKNLRREAEGESRLKMFGYTDPKLGALVAKFMEDLGKACGEAGVSPSKEQLDAALDREFREAGAKLFMLHFEKFDGAYGLAIFQKGLAEKVEKVAEKAREEVIVLTEEIPIEEAQKAAGVFEEPRKPVAARAPARLTLSEAWGEIKKVWEKPTHEFKQLVNKAVQEWTDKVPVPDNAGRELTPFSGTEAAENKAAFSALNNFRDILVSCESLAKEEHKKMVSLLHAVVEAKEAEKKKQAVEDFQKEQDTLAKDALKAQYILRVMGFLKFDVSLELARVRLRGSAGAGFDEFKRELDAAMARLGFDAVSPDRETADRNSEKLNEFLFALYEASLQKKGAGEEMDKLEYVREQASLGIDGNAFFRHAKRRLMQVAEGKLERGEMEQRVKEVLGEMEARAHLLLASPAANEKRWLMGLDKLLYAEYKEGTRKKEEAEKAGDAAAALAWNYYITKINLVRHPVSEAIARKFPSAYELKHRKTEKRPTPK